MEACLAGRPESRRFRIRFRFLALVLVLVLGVTAPAAGAESIEAQLTRELRSLEPSRPAVRQMLIHHYTTPPTLGRADALKVAFNNELAALGQYPKQPRLVAVANGSGSGVGQGFAPGSQIILR